MAAEMVENETKFTEYSSIRAGRVYVVLCNEMLVYSGMYDILFFVIVCRVWHEIEFVPSTLSKYNTRYWTPCLLQSYMTHFLRILCSIPPFYFLSFVSDLFLWYVEFWRYFEEFCSIQTLCYSSSLLSDLTFYQELLPCVFCHFHLGFVLDLFLWWGGVT